MKNIIKYLQVAMTFVVLAAAFVACSDNDDNDSGNIGLGIKVFSPTSVVAGQSMTINGSGFGDVTEIEFPVGIKVTDFEIVTDEMIRVKAPAGIAAEGGRIKVRNAAGETAESRLPLTVGHTEVLGYSAQPGDVIKGNETITIYGKDMQFINRAEFLDEDGNPVIINANEFVRIANGRVVVRVPKNVFEGTFAAKLYTIDGHEFALPEFEYEKAADGGHWETIRHTIWKNDGSHGAINWGSDYRFTWDGNDGLNECLATVAPEDWDVIKNGTFYLDAIGSDWVQMRITTGWWSTTWTGDDITTGSDRIIDLGDGTYSIEICFAGDPILDVLDAQHLLFTGGGYTPLELYYLETVWIEGEGGHFEKQRTSYWKNGVQSEIPAPNWSGEGRFARASSSTGEETYAFTDEDWEILKAEPFRIMIEAIDEYPNIRITTGWWSADYGGKDFNCAEFLETDDEGNLFIELNLSLYPDMLDLIDQQHLLFTGSGYRLLEIYQEKEVWVGGGGDAAKKPIVIWENPGMAGPNWSSDFRFASEEASTGEECCTVPMDQWSVIKDGTFYLLYDGNESSNVRITTGWWTSAYGGTDHNCIDFAEDDPDTGKKVIKINIKADGNLYDNLDAQHLLFTGSDYTPLKLYYYE